MKNQSVIRFLKIIAPILLWGFVVYNLLPMAYFEVYEVEEELAPRPYVERITYLFGTKVKDKEKALKVLDERGVDRLYGFVRNIYKDRIFPLREFPQCEFITQGEIPLFRKFLNLLFEFIPYRFFNGDSINFIYHIDPAPSFCKIFFNYSIYEDYPKLFRNFILDFSRNMTYKRVYGKFVFERNVLINGNRRVEVYGFSTRSFYYPGEKTIYPFKLFVNTNRKNSLILIFKNGNLIRVYDTDKVVVKIKETGNYVVKVYKYRWKFLNYFFGLRFVAYSSPIELSY